MNQHYASAKIDALVSAIDRLEQAAAYFPAHAESYSRVADEFRDTMDSFIKLYLHEGGQ